VHITVVSYNKRRYFISSFPFLSCIDVTPVCSVSFHFLLIHETREQVLEGVEWKFRNPKCSLVNTVGSLTLFPFLPTLHLSCASKFLFLCVRVNGVKGLKVLISAAYFLFVCHALPSVSLLLV
jgi:hypothetical protein